MLVILLTSCTCLSCPCCAAAWLLLSLLDAEWWLVY